MKNFILYSAFLLLHFLTFGQNPYYFKIDKTKGLPSNGVYDMLQDHNGMMWFSTNEGICSYDGKKFNSYNNENQTSKSGSNIIEDAYGRIWYCTFDGFIYYLEHGIIKSLAQSSPIGYQKFNILGNNLLYFENQKLIFLDLKTLRTEKTVPVNTSFIISSIKIGSVFYIYTINTLYEIKSGQDIKTFSVPEYIKNDVKITILTECNGNLLFLSKYSNNFAIYKNGSFTEKTFKGPLDFFNSATYTSNVNWLATTKGIIQSDISTSPIPTKDKRYFEEFNISGIFKDKDGNYWVSTLSDGILFVPDFSNLLIPTATVPTALTTSGDKIYYATKDEKLWVSTLKNEPFNFKKIYQGNANHSIEQLIINPNQQEIYFTSNMFKRTDLKGKSIQEETISIKDIKKLDDTYYLFASSGACGLLKVSNKKSDWDDIYLTGRKQPNYINSNMSSLLLEVRGKSAAYNNHTKTIFFATNRGLYSISKNKTSTILMDGKPINLIKIEYFGNRIYGLTTTYKLLVIKENNQVETVPIAEKIRHETIQKIKLIDSSLYLITNNSAFEYNLKTEKINKFFNVNQDDEITDIVKKENQFVLGTSKGLVVVESKKTEKNSIPKLLINSVTVNNKISTFENLKDLEYDQNNIEINYSVISYIPNLKNILFYKINNGRWVAADDNSRSLILSSIGSGNYTISFKTAFHNEFSDITTFQINIKKPFWENYGFITLILLLIVIGVRYFYKNQINKINKTNQFLLEKIELEKNLNKSTLKAIKSQMNPHFFYNALNTIQSYILSNDKKMALNYLSKFSTLTRTILEMSEKEYIGLAEEIKTINLYLEIEQARFNEDFEYAIEYENLSELEPLKIPSMLLQPYIENAIKHGLLHKVGPKKFIISFVKNKKTLQIKIDDNGIGRQKSSELNSIKSKKHQSFATEAMQNRIDLLNKNKSKKISINYIDKINENQQPTGTTVIIEIPIN